MYEVLSPLGETAVKALSAAPRLPDLNGKTVCEISNGRYMCEMTFSIIRELLKKRYPGVKVIPYTEFPIQETHGNATEMQQAAEETAALARQRGCDAAISGNGF